MSILRGKGVLLPIQKEVLSELVRINDIAHFYLTGGTALSEFYFAHRRSYDLDLFTSEENLIIPFTRRLEAKLLKNQYTVKTTRRFESFVDLYFILNTEPIEALMEKAKQKDPGFDPYWLCAALREVKNFLDNIDEWPVDMLVELDVKKMQNKFMNLAYQIMDKIKGGSYENLSGHC